mmetsp:Transcript_20314/g.51629  ORF Transcript_20314/g.51629 Transcript_20314/m.51629 type:complete len:482 (-) Transcript_20314:101-1546(-)
MRVSRRWSVRAAATRQSCQSVAEWELPSGGCMGLKMSSDPSACCTLRVSSSAPAAEPSPATPSLASEIVTSESSGAHSVASARSTPAPPPWARGCSLSDRSTCELPPSSETRTSQRLRHARNQRERLRHHPSRSTESKTTGARTSGTSAACSQPPTRVPSVAIAEGSRAGVRVRDAPPPNSAPIDLPPPTTSAAVAVASALAARALASAWRCRRSSPKSSSQPHSSTCNSRCSASARAPSAALCTAARTLLLSSASACAPSSARLRAKSARSSVRAASASPLSFVSNSPSARSRAPSCSIRPASSAALAARSSAAIASSAASLPCATLASARRSAAIASASSRPSRASLSSSASTELVEPSSPSCAERRLHWSSRLLSSCRNTTSSAARARASESAAEARAVAAAARRLSDSMRWITDESSARWFSPKSVSSETREPPLASSSLRAIAALRRSCAESHGTLDWPAAWIGAIGDELERASCM